jgi:hypothetical protein
VVRRCFVCLLMFWPTHGLWQPLTAGGDDDEDLEDLEAPKLQVDQKPPAPPAALDGLKLATTSDESAPVAYTSMPPLEALLRILALQSSTPCECCASRPTSDQ